MFTDYFDDILSELAMTAYGCAMRKRTNEMGEGAHKSRTIGGLMGLSIHAGSVGLLFH